MIHRLFLAAAVVTVPCISGCSSEAPTESATDDTRACSAGKVASGAAIHGPNGIAFDARDQLLIASVVGRDITVMDTSTGKITNRIGTDKGVEGPDDLLVAPDGSIYWTSTLTGEIGRLSPDGTKKTQAVGAGVNPIALSSSGRLFTALDFLGDAVYELDPKLEKAPRLIAKDLGYVNGMQLGPDGKLYGALFSKGQVVRIDVDADKPETAELETSVEVVAAGFAVPASAKFDRDGALHAIDFATGLVWRIDTTTAEKTQVAALEPGLDNIAFDSKNGMYVSNTITGEICRVENGKGKPLAEGGLIAVGGLAVTRSVEGRDAVVAANLWSLVEIDPQTRKSAITDRRTFAPDGLVAPFTVSPDGTNLLLTSWFPAAIQVWDPVAHKQVHTVTFEDKSLTPTNAIKYRGEYVVADIGSHSVVKLDLATKKKEELAGSVMVPSGLAATEQDLWVADWAAGTVLRIAHDGASVRETWATGLQAPEGLAVDREGNVLVVESGAKKLSRIRTSTCVNGSACKVETVAEGLSIGLQAAPGVPPTWLMSSVALGSRGEIYVSADVEGGVQRVCPR